MVLEVFRVLSFAQCQSPELISKTYIQISLFTSDLKESQA